MVVSENVRDAALVLNLPPCQNGVRLHKSLGLHPEHACLKSLSTVLNLIRENHTKLACVGEIGLDFSPHILGHDDAEAVKALQRECMRQQVELAYELDLPVNVHSRGAGHHALSLLRETVSASSVADTLKTTERASSQTRARMYEGRVRAVMHAWDGKAKYAAAAAADSQQSIYFSVPPCASRSPVMIKWIERLPLESLLLETDCPALAAVKGEVNVPRNLQLSLQVIGARKGVGLDIVREITRKNAEELFGLQAGKE